VVRPQSTLARVLQNEPAMFRPSDVLPYELRPGYVGRLKRREYDVGIRIDGQKIPYLDLLARCAP
jgi:hypothetical protein